MTDATSDDGLPDDRVTCSTCTHAVRNHSYCRAYAFGIILEKPLRCAKYDPRPGSADVRTGAERWPDLRKGIEEARALEQKARAK